MCVLRIVTQGAVHGETKENKGKLWWNHDASVGAATPGEKAHLQTKQ